MKKLYAIAVVVAITLPVLAWSASPYLSSFKDGKYDCSITSVIPDLNGLKCQGLVKHVGNNVEITVTYKDGKEVWTHNDNTLIQKEFDVKTNKEVQNYGATASNTPTPNSQTFNINCKGGKCDAGVSPKNKWTIMTTASGFDYKVIGTPRDKQNEEAKLRHTFSFKLAK